MAVITHHAMASVNPASYQRHWTHDDDDRTWPETNCYVDVWIEVLHVLGLDPMAAMAFTLSTDFDGEQWEFFKYPAEDLRRIYGLKVHEVNIWRPLTEHIIQHLELGHLFTVEVDSWFLPDTAGVSYQTAHQKTTIVPLKIDVEAKRIVYFHNRGCYEASGSDFDGIVSAGPSATGLPPYAEVIVLDGLMSLGGAELRSAVGAVVEDHMERRPLDNPIARLAKRLESDISTLIDEDTEYFHAYAFATLRQCGAWAQSLSSFLEWLDPVQHAGSSATFHDLSSAAKTCQFKLARLAAGRKSDISELTENMAKLWATGYQQLSAERS